MDRLGALTQQLTSSLNTLPSRNERKQEGSKRIGVDLSELVLMLLTIEPDDILLHMGSPSRHMGNASRQPLHCVRMQGLLMRCCVREIDISA